MINSEHKIKIFLFLKVEILDVLNLSRIILKLPTYLYTRVETMPFTQFYNGSLSLTGVS